MRIRSILGIVILGALTCISQVFAFVSPGAPQNYVSDFANIIPNDIESNLNQELKKLDVDTGAQLAIVTVNSLDQETIESYSVQLFEEWGIGKGGRDNGLLLLIAPNERKVRIEVGYGLEGTITDARASNVIRNHILPSFVQGDMVQGIIYGIQEIITLVRDESYGSEFDKNNTESGLGFNDIAWFTPYIFVIIVSFLARSRSWWFGGILGGVFSVLHIIFIEPELPLLIKILSVATGIIFGLFVDYTASKFGGPGGGFGGGFINGLGGRNNFGGGFGGFGGGRSGGGGSSGSW